VLGWVPWFYFGYLPRVTAQCPSISSQTCAESPQVSPPGAMPVIPKSWQTCKQLHAVGLGKWRIRIRS
jgi:hypothetical protein